MRDLHDSGAGRICPPGPCEARPGGKLRRNPPRPRRNTLRYCVLLVSLAFRIGAADAHALLDHADPRVGNTVKSPHAVSLWFTQNLERGFCSVEVLDAGGARMNAGNAVVDGKLMRVQVKALPAGAYTVKWHVLSVDTHTTEGNFTFGVSP
jgi:copper resistance protein C